MCGITGYFSPKEIKADSFAKANNIIRHRGPDDFGYLFLNRDFSVSVPKDENLSDAQNMENFIGGFGFRRLSIIDLSSNGHQPMSYNSEKLWIVFNGEIYNYIELRTELVKKGHLFKSNTDTEVILAAYMEWGVNCLQRFNGMWSFALLDIEKRQLICSRDRLGIKPFYYHYDGHEFGFGSEIKQLLEIFPNLRNANKRVLFDYLALGAYGNETEETFFDQIKKLPAGSYFIFDLNGGVAIRKDIRYWDLPGIISTKCDEKEIFQSIRELLLDSIRLRLQSDVPLGVCLSGGLDSSGISMLAGQLLNDQTNPLKLFTIGSLDPAIDETNYARIISESFPSRHIIKIPDGNDLANDLSKFIWHHDEPLIKSSMFGGYHVYKLAKDFGTTVVLDGQGADELMGGYNTGIQYTYLTELLSNFQFNSFINEINSESKVYHVNKLRMLSQLGFLILKKEIRQLIGDSYHPTLLKSTSGWLKKEYIQKRIGKSIIQNKGYMQDSSLSFESAFKQNSYELLRYTNLPGILRQVDRNSMAFSVEARIPFLDYRLVEYLFTLPVNLHQRAGYTKYAYRKSMQGIIPEKILWRTDKQGFSMSDRLLLAGAGDYIQTILSGIPSTSEIFDKESIDKIYKKELEADVFYRPIFWRVVNALVWHDIFKISLEL
jgi:asparagine synthase (glutamine-hydrolysing)